MATLTNAYAAPASFTVTDQSLTTGQVTSTSIYTNTAGYPDLLVGGVISISAGTTVAGETIDIYITAQYSDTATDITGGIDAALTADALAVDDTDYISGNLILFAVVSQEAAATQDYHWGPFSAAAAFGGTLPENIMFVIDNATSATTDVVEVTYVGVTPTSTA